MSSERTVTLTEGVLQTAINACKLCGYHEPARVLSKLRELPSSESDVFAGLRDELQKRDEKIAAMRVEIGELQNKLREQGERPTITRSGVFQEVWTKAAFHPEYSKKVFRDIRKHFDEDHPPRQNAGSSTTSALDDDEFGPVTEAELDAARESSASPAEGGEPVCFCDGCLDGGVCEFRGAESATCARTGDDMEEAERRAIYDEHACARTGDMYCEETWPADPHNLGEAGTPMPARCPGCERRREAWAGVRRIADGPHTGVTLRALVAATKQATAREMVDYCVRTGYIVETEADDLRRRWGGEK